MKLRVWLALAALGVSALATSATAGEIQSGPPVGKSPGSFNVKAITGPEAGESLCYV